MHMNRAEIENGTQDHKNRKDTLSCSTNKQMRDIKVRK